jgi:glycosyltransferase involved in cell wall biosynthesis
MQREVRRSQGSRLRIGFLAQENLGVPPPVPGASVSRVVYELATRLAAGRDVTVASLPHPTVPEGTFRGVRYLRIPDDLDKPLHDHYIHVLRVLRRLHLPYRELQGTPFYSHRYAEHGLRRLAEHEPDIVHLQNVSQFLPLAHRHVPGAHLVLHMHCDWLAQLPPAVVRRRLALASLVLGVSDYITGRIREAFPDLAPRCRTLHNGVDLDLFRPRDQLQQAQRDASEALRERFALGEGPVVLYVGTMAPEKGTDVLLQAFAELRRRLPAARLVIVGRHNRYFQVRSPRGRSARARHWRIQREYPQRVAALAEPLGEAVVFAGGLAHEELPPFYALADVFVMPSTGQEPFPLPVLEALSSGVPVAATRRGGLPEVVRDGVNGALVAPGDPDALAGTLEELCRDPAGSRELGAAGRALVTEHFSWEAQAVQLAAYYDEVVAEAIEAERPASRVRSR